MWTWIKKSILFLFLLILLGVFCQAIYNRHNNYKNVQELEETKEQLKRLKQKENEKWKKEITKETGLDKFSEFEENPDLLEKWLKKFTTYWEVKHWLDTGIKPTEFDFACWIYSIKSKQFSDFQTQIEYQEPLWIKDNVNIEELRKEYLESKND